MRLFGIGTRFEEFVWWDKYAQAPRPGLRVLNLIGGDVIELAPPFDQTNSTAFVGTNLMFEML